MHLILFLLWPSLNLIGCSIRSNKKPVLIKWKVWRELLGRKILQTSPFHCKLCEKTLMKCRIFSRQNSKKNCRRSIPAFIRINQYVIVEFVSGRHNSEKFRGVVDMIVIPLQPSYSRQIRKRSVLNGAGEKRKKRENYRKNRGKGRAVEREKKTERTRVPEFPRWKKILALITWDSNEIIKWKRLLFHPQTPSPPRATTIWLEVRINLIKKKFVRQRQRQIRANPPFWGTLQKETEKLLHSILLWQFPFWLSYLLLIYTRWFMNGTSSVVCDMPTVPSRIGMENHALQNFPIFPIFLDFFFFF